MDRSLADRIFQPRSPQTSLLDSRDWWPEADAYVRALAAALPASTRGLAAWDVANEPESGGASGLPGEHGARWAFVEHAVRFGGGI